MSEVKGGANTPNQNNVVATSANTPPAPNTTKPVIPTSRPAPATTTTVPNSAQPPTPQPQNVQFHSNNIATVQSARRQNPFAEQNAKAAEKKQQNSKLRKRIFIVVGVILAIVLAGLIGWMIYRFMNPEEEVSNIPSISFNEGSLEQNLDTLQNLINQTYDIQASISVDGEVQATGDLNAVEQVYKKIAREPQNKEYVSQIYFQKFQFYFYNGYYQEIITNKEEIKPEDLDAHNRALYYNYLSLAYYYTGDEEAYADYAAKANAILTGPDAPMGLGG